MSGVIVISSESDSDGGCEVIATRAPQEGSAPRAKSKAPSLAFLCPEARCSYVAKRLSHLRGHGAAKHKKPLHSKEMELFARESLSLSRAGRRYSTTDRVRSLLGESFAHSKTHFDCAVNVLNGHLVTVKQDNLMETTSDGNLTEQKVATIASDKTSRRDAIEKFKSAGMKVNCSRSELCQLAEIFLNILKSRNEIEEKQMFSNARLVDRFIDFGTKQPECLSPSDAVLCPSLPRRFFDAANTCMAYFTVRNHMVAMTLFLEACLTSAQLSPFFPTTKKHLIRNVLQIWADLKKDVSRKASRQQRVKMFKGDLPEFPITELLLFQAELRSSGLLKTCLSQLCQRDTTERHDIPPRLHAAYSVVLCAVASMLLLHCVRLTAATQLTVTEVHAARSCEGFFVIRVHAHKTQKSEGAAAIALRPEQYALLRRFVNLRKNYKLIGENVLATHTGGVPTAANLFKPLNNFLKEKLRKDFQVTFNGLRKVVESYAHVAPPLEKQHISRYLNHGPGAVNKHYKFKTDSLAVSGSRSVCQVLAQLVARDLAPHILPTNPKDEFPSVAELQTALQERWISNEVPLERLSEETYFAVRDTWVEKNIQEAANLAVAGAGGSFIESDVQKSLQHFPAIWRNECKGPLLSYVRAIQFEQDMSE